MKKFLLALSVLVACVMATPAHGQLSGLMGGNRNSNNENASPEQMINTFVESRSHVLSAQADFVEAFGLQDQATRLRAEQQAFASGPIDSASLQKISELSSETQDIIDGLIASQPELDESSRAKYSEGLVHYGLGLLAAKRTVDMAQGAGRSMTRNPAAMGQARVAAQVARDVPAYFQGLQGSTRMAFDYGRRNNIDPPADATALLGGL